MSGGTAAGCSASNWWSTAAAKYITCFSSVSYKKGSYWGAIMGGNNSYGHDGYLYAR